MSQYISFSSCSGTTATSNSSVPVFLVPVSNFIEAPVNSTSFNETNTNGQPPDITDFENIATLDIADAPAVKPLSDITERKDKERYIANKPVIQDAEKHTVVSKKKNKVNKSKKKATEDRQKKSPEVKVQRKDTYRKQFFSLKWLEIPEFKDWLDECVSPEKGMCRYCDVEITAGKSELQRHANSRRHGRNRGKYLEMQKCRQKRKEESYKLKTIGIVDTDNNELSVPSAEITRIIDYRSDSMSVPSYEMKMAMVNAPSGDTSYNTDNCVKAFEKRVASLLDKEAGLFFPTHIMANLVAVLAHCWSRGSTVICGDQSDICINNGEALIKFGGLICSSLPNKPDGTFSTDELEELLKDIAGNVYFSNLVCVESTHAKLGGIVPDVEWISQISVMCRNYRTILHCDGTRLADSSVYMQMPLKEIIKDCDSVTFGIDKSLGAPLGAAVIGGKDFIRRCEFLRNSLGGHIHQAGIFAAAGTFALQDLVFVEEQHKKAWSIAIAVTREKSKFITVELETVHTNMVHLKCMTDKISAQTLSELLADVSEEQLQRNTDEPSMIFVETVDDQTLSLKVHKDISDSDVKKTIDKLRQIMRKLAKQR